MAPLQCRIPEDPAALLEPCILFNEQQALAVRERHRLDRLLHLPVGLQELHQFLIDLGGDEEAPDIQVQTWFLNHRTAWRCNIPRALLLSPHIQEWTDQLAHLWRDELVPGMPMNYHLVTPRPYDLEANIQAHLLVVQPEEFDIQAILISMYDNALYGNRVHRFAVLHGPLLTLQDLRDHSDRDRVCLWPQVQCEAWFGWQQIDEEGPLVLQSGYGVTFLVQRPQEIIPEPHDWDQFDPLTPEESQVLLQTKTQVSRTTLSLADLIEDPSPDHASPGPGVFVHPGGHRQLVHLISANLRATPPPYVETSLNPTAAQLEDELRQWGLFAQVHLLADRALALCFEPHALESTGLVLVHDDLQDLDGVRIHWVSQLPTELELMQLLYSFGYQKSVILQVQMLWSRLYQIDFHDSKPALEIPEPALIGLRFNGHHNNKPQLLGPSLIASTIAPILRSPTAC